LNTLIGEVANITVLLTIFVALSGEYWIEKKTVQFVSSPINVFNLHTYLWFLDSYVFIFLMMDRQEDRNI